MTVVIVSQWFIENKLGRVRVCCTSYYFIYHLLFRIGST